MSFRSNHRRILLTTLAGVVCGAVAQARSQGIQYPGDANVVVITSFGVTPSDGIDDTAAFQAALNATVGSDRILYLPNGVYNLSDRLNWGGVAGGNFVSVQGQSQSGVVLQLANNAAGFGDSQNAKVFLDVYEGNTANAFRNYLQDLTIDVGSGNPGVIGLQFQSNNTGALRNLTIRSAGIGRAGVLGLDLNFNFPGPFLAQNITIEGFDQAILGAPQEYSATFDGLTIRNQNVLGMAFWRLPVQIRNLVSQNSVPALRNNANPGAWGHVVIDGAELNGGPQTNAAIFNEDSGGVLVLRNVTTQGYGLAVNDLEANVPTTVPGGLVTQYTTDAPLSLHPSPPGIVAMPVEDAPPSPVIPLAEWVSVKAFGAVENDNLDDGRAVQAAMDSGASVIYFPTGQYVIAETINVGPSVRRIEGLKSNILTNAPLATENIPFLRIKPGAQPVVHINGLNSSFQSPGFRGGGSWIEHATANTLVVRDGDISYRNSVPGGKLFLENVVGNNLRFTGQRVWARQLNPEGSTIANIVNDGGDFYVLGLKTEGDGTVLETRNRGRSVVMGGLIYPATTIVDRTRPMFVNDESFLSVSVPESCYVADGTFGIWVRETRNGITTTLPRSAIARGHSNCGGMISLYTSSVSDSSSPVAPGTPSLVSRTLDSIHLSWSAASDAQSGIARYNVYRNGTFYRSSMSNTLVDEDIADGTNASYRVSAVNGAGLESPLSGSFSASTLADATPPRLLSSSAGKDPRFVRLLFSEPLQTASATLLANYTLAGPVPMNILGASLAANGREVTLTTSGLAPGTNIISVAGILDRATTPNNVAPGTRLAFTHDNVSNGTGLLATYWSGRDFTGTPLLTRVDSSINFDYGTGSAAQGLPVDNFSVRWIGQLQPRFSEATTIFIRSDDGARVFIDGKLVIGRWIDQGATEVSATVPLDSSRLHDIVVEYYENSFGALVQLSWQSASLAKQVIPSSALLPTPRLTTLRTFQGSGADVGLDRFSTTDNGAGNSMSAFHSPASGGFHQAGYYRFDLTQIDLNNNYIADGIATLSQTFFGIGDGKRQINFFGVNQSANGDNWIEAGPGFVTWETAAGNDNTGSLADPATAKWVSTFLLDNTGFQNNNQHDKAFFEGPRLLDFLRADTDGRVTFLFKRVDASNEGQSYFTKEWGVPGAAPALKLLLIPKCPQITFQPIAPASVSQGSTLAVTVGATGQETLTYQWLLNGQPVADGPQANDAILTGTNSPTLLIENARCGDPIAYSVAITNACGGVTSSPITFAVTDCGPTCDSIDINNDGGLFDPQDIDAYLSIFSEGPCIPETATCNDIDFNNDGSLFDPCDIDSFLLVFAEGPCTLCGQ